MYAIGTANLPIYIHKDHDHMTSQEKDCPSERIFSFVDDSINIIKADTVDYLKIKSQETIEKVE